MAEALEALGHRVETLRVLGVPVPSRLADAVDRIVTQAAAMLVVPPASPDGLVEAQAG